MTRSKFKSHKNNAIDEVFMRYVCASRSIDIWYYHIITIMHSIESVWKMTIVTIWWNWAQALNHTVILENVTRAQRIYIWIMNIFIVYTRKTHTYMHQVWETKCHAFGKYWCWHKHRSDTNMSARGFSLIVWVNFRIYYIGNTMQAGKQNIKSHIQAYYFGRAMCSTLLSCYSVAAFSHYSLWHCMSKCWAFACIGSFFSQLP